MARTIAKDELHLRNSSLRLSRVDGLEPEPAPENSAEYSFNDTLGCPTVSVSGSSYRPTETVLRSLAGDGVTNDTAGLQAALTAAADGLGVVVLPPGSYSITQVLIPSNVALIGSPGAELVSRNTAPAFDQGLIKLAGTVTATTQSLTGNVSAGAQSVSVASTASFAVGDHLILRDNTYFNSIDTAARNQEIVRVISKDATTLTFSSYLSGSYTTAQAAQVALLAPVVGARVQGIRFRIPSGNTGGGIFASYAIDCLFDDVHVTGNKGTPGFRLDTCYRCHFTRWSARDTFDPTLSDGTNYGLIFNEGTAFSSARGGFTEKVRENTFTNYTHHCDYVGNHERGIRIGFNTHGSHCDQIDILHNKIEDAELSGIHVGATSAKTRDTNVRVIGNIIRRSGDDAIMVSNATGGTAPLGITIADNHILDCSFRSAAGTGIYAGGVDGLIIRGNRIDGGSGTPTYGIRVVSCLNGSVDHNVIQNVGGSGRGIGLDDSTRVMVDQNSFSGIAGANFHDQAGNTGCRTTLNLADDASVTLVDVPSTLNTWD